MEFHPFFHSIPFHCKSWDDIGQPVLSLEFLALFGIDDFLECLLPFLKGRLRQSGHVYQITKEHICNASMLDLLTGTNNSTMAIDVQLFDRMILVWCTIKLLFCCGRVDLVRNHAGDSLQLRVHLEILWKISGEWLWIKIVKQL